MDFSKSCLSLLQEANNTSCATKRAEILRKWCLLIKTGDQTSHSNLISSISLHDQLIKLLSSHGFILEFKGRDFTSYDKSDFENYDISARGILEVTISYVSLLKSQKCKIDPAPLNLEAQEIADNDANDNVNNDININQKIPESLRDYVLKVLPDLLLLIGGNIRNPMWSSEHCQKLSVTLLKMILDLFNCNDIQEILLNYFFLRDQSEISKLKDKNMLGYMFHVFERPLSRDKWEKNPFLCEVFSWLILNVKSPNLTNHIDQIMAVCLNFIHSHEASNKLKGFYSLKHLIENTSGEELRWYNRAEVIYETLKNQMYSKEELVVDSVLQCVFLIVKILERKPLENSDKHHEIMSNLLRDTEMENLIILRRIFISRLAGFFLDCGILCVQHLSKILQVIETFLEIEDLPQESARIEALQALENVIVVAWPRIPYHSERILQFLVKLVINIETKGLWNAPHINNVKMKLVSKIVVCVKLLLQVNPDLQSSLEELKLSENLLMIRKFCSEILLVS